MATQQLSKMSKQRLLRESSEFQHRCRQLWDQCSDCLTQHPAPAASTLQPLNLHSTPGPSHGRAARKWMKSPPIKWDKPLRTSLIMNSRGFPKFCLQLCWFSCDRELCSKFGSPCSFPASLQCCMESVIADGAGFAFVKHLSQILFSLPRQ